MTRIAAHSMETDPADVEFVDGELRPKGSPSKAMSMGDVAMLAHLFKARPTPRARTAGSSTTPHLRPSLTSRRRARTARTWAPSIRSSSHACHIPVVEVDLETGVVKILKYYAVNDCGTIMNPRLVEGQIMGGIVQGIGAALMEEYRYDDDDGTLQTGTLREYLLPSMHEAPEIVIEHQQTPSPFSEYGVKGAGEGGRLVAPTAIASAIDDALKPAGRDRQRAADDAGARRRGDRGGAARRERGHPAAPVVGAAGGIVRRGTAAAEAAAPTPERVLAGARLIRDGPPVPPRPRALPGDAAVPRPPGVLGARLPHAAGPAGDRRAARGAADNDACLGYMSELRHGHDALGRAHRRARAHDRRRGRPLARRLGARPTSATSARCAATRPRSRRSGGAACSTTSPGHRGVDALGAGEPVTARRGRGDRGRARASPPAPGTSRCSAPGYLRYWPDARAPRRAQGRRARHLRPRGCWPSATSWPSARTPRPSRSSPRPDPGEPANPQPVHTLLLIERGIYIMEGLDLEAIAAAGMREFLFVALPLAIRGATGSMIDPVAIT